MNAGPPRQGIRYHPSYNVDEVRVLVEKKIRRTLGMDAVKLIEVDILSYSLSKTGTKNLSLE